MAGGPRAALWLLLAVSAGCTAGLAGFMDDAQAPLPGTARGSPESFVRNFENVFTEELVEAILRELQPLDDMAKTGGTLPFGKRQTFWVGRDQPPRCAAERAIKLLQQLTFPESLGGAGGFGIVGCKYWVQARASDSDVDFHYDKDEGLASAQQIIKLPPLVGVTHLEEWGAPTVVLNQTSIANGNLDAPTVPSSGWLVYPKRNKHCIHRGDLHHGAPQDMAAVPVPNGAKRHSFITSWEVEKPLEPNCRRVSDSELNQMLGAHSLFAPGSPSWLDFGALSQHLTEVDPVLIDWSHTPEGEHAVTRQRVPLPFGRVAHLDVLRTPQPGVTYLVDWSGGHGSNGTKTMEAIGPGNEQYGLSFMGVFDLSPRDSLQMRHIRNSRALVVFVFYTGRSQFKLAEVFANTVTRQVMLSGEVGEAPPIETFLADTKTCGDIMRGFRVSSAETPIVAAGRSVFPPYTARCIRTCVNGFNFLRLMMIGNRGVAGSRFSATPYVDARWVMQPTDLPVTVESFQTFVQSVLSAERRPSDDLKTDAEARAAAGTKG